MYTMNTLQTIEFDDKNRNKNISGTIYRSDLCLYAKRTGGHRITAHIKHSLEPNLLLYTVLRSGKLSSESLTNI